MSRLHATLLIVWALSVLAPLMLAMTVMADFLIIVALALGCGAFGCLMAADFSNIYPLPLTRELRDLNRKRGVSNEASALRHKANECRKLAKTYRDRDDSYSAEILEAQADANEREAAMREEDAQRIQRELEDRKMGELTR